MEIKQATFYKSMQSWQSYPGGELPEIAFAGKSNVGKSSLINYLCNNGKLARTSKQPGKTRLVNFFKVNGDQFYLVDLPGYGFAKVSKKEQLSWGKMMEDYFRVATNLKILFILLDIRHKPTQDDVQMISWAQAYNLNYVLIATKCDKIAKSKRITALNQLKKELGLIREYEIVPVSSESKQGKERILEIIEQAIWNVEDGEQDEDICD